MVIVPSPGDPINDEIDAICMFLKVFSKFEKCLVKAKGEARRK